MDNRLLFTGPLQSYCLEDSHQAACMARVKARPPAQHVRQHKDKLKAGSTGAPSGALGKLCTQNSPTLHPRAPKQTENNTEGKAKHTKLKLVNLKLTHTKSYRSTDRVGEVRPELSSVIENIKIPRPINNS